MKIQTTKYYEDFLRYFKLALKQQEVSNLGTVPHAKSDVDDDLMEHIELYDVVERKYAGFSQIVHDAFYGWSEDHPYWEKMKCGNITWQREKVAKDWSGKQQIFGLEEWLYVLILHRVCGSGINYGVKPSGYHNTLLFDLYDCDTIEDMCDRVKSRRKPFYTSVGYQFPAFPKPPKSEQVVDLFSDMSDFEPEHIYKRGGDYFLCEFVPRLCRDMAKYLQHGDKKELRELGEWMFQWNADNGLRAYRFQYAAIIADVCDWFPEYVHRESMFYYGTNAVECIGYLAKPSSGKGSKKSLEFLDAVMHKIYEDTNSLPYNAEDVACDFIRWIENYLRPGADYAHIDMDTLWNSSSIKDHPFGRQKAMLDLGLVETFNGMTSHPSDDKIIKGANVSIEDYKKRVAAL
jgi:hypothetical protein